MIAQVHLDQASAELTSSGAVVGPLWLDVGGVAFPEVGWYDFPVPILTWWIGALRGLTSRSSNEASLQFMDGPFELRIERIDRATGAAFLRSGEPMLPEVEIDADELLTSSLECAAKLISTLQQRGVVSSDLEHLVRVARRLD